MQFIKYIVIFSYIILYVFTVTIKHNSGDRFKGFFIQAQKAFSEDDAPLGTFTPVRYKTTNICGRVSSV